MDRVNQILQNKIYQGCLQQIEKLEENRIFCKHDLVHFLDVARVAYIMNLEEGMQLPKEEIYAAALLHDIGRHEQYLHGIPHHEASANIATSILEVCGFSDDEKKRILDAILEHRMKTKQESMLSDLICKADKISRPCYGCKAEQECNWSLEKKNHHLKY